MTIVEAPVVYLSFWVVGPVRGYARSVLLAVCAL